MDAYGVIYLIRNKINNKVYVGQTTTDFYTRYGSKNWYNCVKNKHLLSSISKYGVDSFAIKECIDKAFSKEELDRKEVEWIDFYNSTNPAFGYNKKEGGGNGKPSVETLEKISKANRLNAIGREGIKRHPNVSTKIKDSKMKNFVNSFTSTEISNISSDLKKGLFKKDICATREITLWQLNKIIDLYKLEYSPKSSMSGVCGEKHHNFNNAVSQETKDKISETANKKIIKKYSKEIPDIKRMLDEGCSITKISKHYSITRAYLRKILKMYDLY